MESSKMQPSLLYSKRFSAVASCAVCFFLSTLYLISTRTNATGAPHEGFSDGASHEGCSDVDCSWTANWSCPGQRKGSKGIAAYRDDKGFNCCCLNGTRLDCLQHSCPDQPLGSEGKASHNDTTAHHLCCMWKNLGTWNNDPEIIDHTGCSDVDCSWTANWSCPGQRKGSKGIAKYRDDKGFNCCCLNSTQLDCTWTANWSCMMAALATASAAHRTSGRM